MTIEVDYFAWEKWQDEQKSKIDFPPNHPYEFVISKRIGLVNSGEFLASISCNTDKHPNLWFYYELFTENSQLLIVKVTWVRRLLYDDRFDTHIDATAVPSATAITIDNLLAALPTPQEAGIHGTPMGGVFYHYNLILGNRYQSKEYDWGAGHSLFEFANRKLHQTFDEKFHQFLSICDSLFPHRNLSEEPIRLIIERYKSLFISKAKYMKHQGRWKGSDKSSHEWSYYWRSTSNFSTSRSLLKSYEKAEMLVWEKLIDFKYYLPHFLNYLAFAHYDDLRQEQSLFLQKLKEADIATWDEDEQAILKDYFLALFPYSFAYYPSLSIDSTELFWALQGMGYQIAPYLVIWENSLTHVDAVRHLGNFLQKLINTDKLDSLPQELQQWLLKPSLMQAIDSAAQTFQNRPYTPEITQTLENLRFVQAYLS